VYKLRNVSGGICHITGARSLG